MIDTPYYYMATAWDCRPQESNPSNMVGPLKALAERSSAAGHRERLRHALRRDQRGVGRDAQVVGRSVLRQATFGKYNIYRGSTKGGGILSKAYIGKITADGSNYYTFFDNSTNNVALTPPSPGSYYYYIARAVSLDSIPSIDSNEYGAVYFSGSISACQITQVVDFPDDEGTALTVTWKKSPSETCWPNPITEYEVKRKSTSRSEFCDGEDRAGDRFAELLDRRRRPVAGPHVYVLRLDAQHR